jgi:DNA-binding NarL/FixJ family response regulator
MLAAPGSRRRLEGIALAIAGRHELYVASLAALASSLGAEVRVLPSLAEAEGSALEQVELLLLESPHDSDLERLAEGPPLVVLEDGSVLEHRRSAASVLAAAVIEKNASLAQLSLAIRDALERGSTEETTQLTGRQREVLELIVQGLDNGQIADRLGISHRTARAHVSALLERLGVENRVQAAVAAVRQGWVSRPSGPPPVGEALPRR